MGIASLVIGIISAVLGFIPLCNYFALIPAAVGLIFGIIDIPLSKKKQKSIGFGIAGTVLNVLAIALIVVWTMVIGGVAAETSKTLDDMSGKTKTVISKDYSKPEFILSSEALYKEYKANEVSADSKYKNKIIQISGVIENIGKDVMGKPYVILAGEGVIEGLNGIQCFFNEDQAGDFANLQKGQNVTIIGKCDGMMLGINLGFKDCIIKK